MASNDGHRSSDFLSVASSSRPNFLGTFEPESHYPIFSTFCACLSIAEIVSLTRTCKLLSSLYQYLVPVQWDVDKALRHYVNDPHGFRSQLAKYDALVFGLCATDYFERTVGKCQYLDVAIQQGGGSELFSNYLSHGAGYAVTKSSTEILHHFLMAETRIFNRSPDSKTAIRLHITNCPPIQVILQGTYTTVGVCILSWNKAYSIFALPTSIQNRSYLLQPFHSLAKREARHNSQKGWRVQGTMWPEEKRYNHPIRERRRLGDRYTWTIPFNTKNVESSKTPDYVLEHACFKMDMSMSYEDDAPYEKARERVRYYKIEVNKLESRLLKHVYFYGDTHMMDFFLPRLHSSTILEFCKLDPAQRPTNYHKILRNRGDIDAALEGFDRPASWTYRDDEVPTWYKAFERYHPERV